MRLNQKKLTNLSQPMTMNSSESHNLTNVLTYYCQRQECVTANDLNMLHFKAEFRTPLLTNEAGYLRFPEVHKRLRIPLSVLWIVHWLTKLLCVYICCVVILVEFGASIHRTHCWAYQNNRRTPVHLCEHAFRYKAYKAM